MNQQPLYEEPGYGFLMELKHPLEVGIVALTVQK